MLRASKMQNPKLNQLRMCKQRCRKRRHKADKLKEDEDSNAEDTIVEKGASKMENMRQSTV